MPSYLIIGCGYLGQRVASLWVQSAHSAYALTRGRSTQLQALGLIPIPGDVLDEGSLTSLPVVDTVLYAVGLDRSTGKSMREVYVQGLANVLKHLPPPKKFLYISSTSVYGQTDGDWVDETSPTEPTEENGKIILEAEQLVQTTYNQALILRFAGIYGPGRVIRRAAIEKGEPLTSDADKWLNLIHVQDGAWAIQKAAEQGEPGIYLIADDHPVQRRDFYTYMAQQLQAPPAQFQVPVPGTALPPHERTNRRIRNRKMREAWNMELQFPDYKSGLIDAIKTS